MDLHAPPLVVHGYEPHAPLLEVEGLDPHSPQQKVLIHAPTLQSQDLIGSDHRNGGELKLSYLHFILLYQRYFVIPSVFINRTFWTNNQKTFINQKLLPKGNWTH